MAYIGIDVGTTGSKATVVEKDGTILLNSYHEYDLRFPRSGWVEMRPDEVGQASLRALKDAVAQYGGEIEAIAVASFGEAVALLDANGHPVCDSIFYTDVRGNDCLNALREKIDPEALQMRTGMPINGMYTLPKLMWLAKNRPEVLEQAKMILPYGTYIAYLLCGETATDSSLASRTLLFDGMCLDWDDITLSAFGISRECMPRYVPAGSPIGRMLPSVASEFGLKGLPIIVSGVHDQIAAALGAGSLYPGDVSDGIGSAECISAVLPNEMDKKKMFRYNICAEPHAVHGRALSLIFSNTAGAALKWYRNTFAQELRARCDAEGKNSYAELNKYLTEEPSPVLFLPHLAGTGTPYMDAKAQGMIYGLTLATTGTDIYRAILEGNNYEMRYNLEVLSDCGMAFDELTAVGGGASPKALKIKADILQKPIHMLNTQQAGTVGLAMLCGCAVGAFKNIDEAKNAFVKRIGTIEPSSKHRAANDEKYDQYRRMYEAGCVISGRTAELSQRSEC